MTRIITLLRGLAALAALLVLLVGAPWALMTFGGNPLPGGLPTLQEAISALTAPDDGSLLRSILIIAGWAGWALFALSLLVEVASRIRGVRAPQLPTILAPQQHLARGLVSAVVALGTVLTPVAAHAAPAAPAPQAPVAVTSQQVTPPASPHTASPAAPRAGPDSTTHTVQRGDSLWKISKRAYGKGSEYTRLVQASRDTVQPDGSHLSDPDEIQPGWKITVPDAHPAAPARTPAPATPPAPARTTAPTPAPSTAAPQPSTPTTVAPRTAAATRAPSTQAPTTAPSNAPSSAASAPSPAPTTEQATTPASPSSDTTVQAAPDLASDTRTPYGLGMLGAAAVLGLLAAKRSRGGRHRHPGRRVGLPSGEDALVEAQTRVAADPLSAQVLNTALRTLAAHYHARHEAMPAVRAARMAGDTLELYLTDTDHRLPAPFNDAGDGVWILPRTGTNDLLTDDDLDGVPAPFPALVTLGLDEDGASLLINLEEAGTLAITGDPTTSHAVLTALAVELIGSPWADDAVVELVDCLPEIVDAMDCDRVLYSDDLDHSLTILEHIASTLTGMLHRDGLDSALQARAARQHPETWTPRLLIVGHDLTNQQRDRVAALVDTHPRLAIAAITTNTDPVGEWHLRLTAPNNEALTATLNPTGLVITPQLMPESAYRSLIAAFTAADDIDTPGPDWAADMTPTVTLDDLTPDTPEASEAPPVGEGSLTGTPAAAASADETADETVPTQAAHTAYEMDVTELEPNSDEVVGWWLTTTQDHTAAPTPSEDLARRQDAYITSGWGFTDDDEQLDPLAPDAPASAPQSVAHREDMPAGSTRVDLPEPPRTSLDRSPAEIRAGHRLMDLTPDTDLLAGHGPLVRLLGQVHIQDAPGKRPASPGVATDLIAYLVLHPGRGYQALDAAIWPAKRRTATTRNSDLSHFRNWLGAAPDGHPYLSIVEDDTYRVSDDLRCDWTAFQAYIAPTLAEATDANLVAALKLVDGQPLTPPGRRKMAWADRDKSLILAAVADVAHEVATRALRAGDHTSAIWAAHTGLDAEPVVEFLWRDLLLALHASGDRDRLAEAVTRLQITLEAIESDMDDETAELIDRLTHAYALTPA